MKTVVVLGGAYGGGRAAQLLAQGLPDGWRILLIDRNSHFNHVYILPRLAVLPGHEHKAFIPFTNIFRCPGPHSHKVLNAHVLSLKPNSVVLSRAFPEYGIPDTIVPFDFAIYALGAKLPVPLDLWGQMRSEDVAIPCSESKRVDYTGCKAEAIAWLKQKQTIVEAANSILVVGGGALGIQFASDIATVHPSKKVTLLHSRKRFLPRFDPGLHTEILQQLETLNVELILGERLDMESLAQPKQRNSEGQRIIRTSAARELSADLILICTGQKPNTSILEEMDPATVRPGSRLACVLPSMQLGLHAILLEEPISTGSSSLEKDFAQISLEDDETELRGRHPCELQSPYPNIFVVGDSADAFGALQAGHTAWYQAEVASKNILALIRRQEGESEENTLLVSYVPGLPAIKVSLGLRNAVYQVNGSVGVTRDGKDDLHAAQTWPFYGIEVKDESDMYQ